MKTLLTINKPITNLFTFVISLLLITACSKEDGAAVGPDINNASSQLCQNVRGAEAIYWDLSNGIPRTDLPGFVPPTVRTPGGSFFHPDFPPLSFEYPAGYSTETIRASHSAGVNLIRQDNQVVWRWLSTTASGFPSAREIRQGEIQQMLQFLGVNANNIELLCLNEGQINPASGITTRSSTALIRSGGFTALVAAQVTALESLPTSSISIRMAVGPTAEFSQLVFDTFLAIEWQMLYRSSGGVTLDDRDGDGTPDVQDRFPDDPSRQ
ncbi:hypothetical protein OKW21_005535 [Catalinimonas alkaloidigena]|uniref:hypothetical protein n=1 Tax=Catalinimonas alkaloidigena TaxID=1075417 RepID=UPI002404CDB4|nr:hypothetical protein [Catalinimonas alkaloidigena]MDF9800272.1 hypothetical protein [Catalinimonas alkaloidigena]